MKRACFWTILGMMIISSFFGVTTVSALHYTPSVEIGDEIVWEMEAEYLSYEHTYYLKHVVTAIYDSDESTTVIHVNESICEEEMLYMGSAINATRGELEDYVQKDTIDYLFSPVNGGYWYIVPGTKVGMHTDYYSEHPYSENFTLTSINSGYGIEMNISIQFVQFTHTICVYTESGILEKFYGDKEDSDRFVKYDLYSINGKKYRNAIPGYSLPLVLLGIFGGIIGLLVFKAKWKLL